MEFGTYRRREPEKTVLHRVIRENLSTFFERAAFRSGGRGLPTYVRQEFDRYLDCGILANGFARVRCPECGYDSVVGFSCRGRGFCPSCMGRRMVDASAHLVDYVLPEVPIRQWVLSFPRKIRFHLARDSALLSKALEIWIQEVFRHYERQFLFQKEEKDPGKWRYRRRLPWKAERFAGGVTAIQRFGSSLNLNLHFHSLILEGVYWRDPKTGRLLFVRAPEPAKEDLEMVLSRVVHRVTRLLVRKGLLLEGSREEGGTISVEPADPTVMDVVQAASVREFVGLSEGWRRVEVVGRDKDAPWVPAEKPFCAAEEGFTLHAGVWVDGKAREKLEKLCRYLLRPAFAEERLSLRPDGRIEYGLRKPRWDGGTRLVLEPLEFLEKLAALVPGPRSHLLRYHGVLGPHHALRSQVIPPAPPESRECARRRPVEPEEGGGIDPPPRRTRRARRKEMDWAARILRSLKLDVLACPKCGGRMKVIACLTEPGTIRKILRSMDLSCDVPTRAPPRDPPQGEFEFVQ